MKRIPLFCLTCKPGKDGRDDRRNLWSTSAQILNAVHIMRPATTYRVIVERMSYGFLATVWAEE